MKVRIRQVLPSEDKAKSDIKQVLLTNDKAKDMEGRNNLFGVREIGRNTHPRNDAIATIVTIHDHMARRVLFNNGSLSNVPHNEAMKKSRISYDQLKPFPALLIGFGNEEVNVQSVISLPLTLGKEPKATTTMVDFTMVKFPLAYNNLPSHPSQNALRISGSSPHLKVKFPTLHSICILKGDQEMTKQCYNTIVESNE